MSYKVPHKSAQDCPTKLYEKNVSYKSVPQSASYKSVKTWLGACFRARVCIRFRGFHLVSAFVQGFFWVVSTVDRMQDMQTSF